MLSTLLRKKGLNIGKCCEKLLLESPKIDNNKTIMYENNIFLTKTYC